MATTKKMEEVRRDFQYAEKIDQEEVLIFLKKMRKTKKWVGTHADLLREFPSAVGILITDWSEINILAREISCKYGLLYACGGYKREITISLVEGN